MFFKKKFLIIFVSTFLFTTLAFAESNVQFGGYARAGFGLNLSKFNRDYSPLGEGSFSSRHIRDFNYLQLDLTKNFDNGSKLAFSVDTDTFTNAHFKDNWNTAFRVRNAYYSIPVDQNLSVWAGVRYFLFTDIRVLDYLLDYNAMGAGVTISQNTDVFVSVRNGDPTATTPEDLTLVARSTFDLGSNITVSPELHFTKYSPGTQKQTDGNGNIIARKDVVSTVGYLARVVVGFHNESMWNNAFISYNRQPQDRTTTENKQIFTFGDSGSFTFNDSFGLLVGALVNYEKFSTERATYKKGEQKTPEKSRVTASVDLQPVYYMTDRVQLALDLNKTIKTKYFEANETPDAIYVTPIVRYSFNKDTVANAQVYTSLTYANYDWKGVNNGKEATDSLFTMQTGFELAF